MNVIVVFKVASGVRIELLESARKIVTEGKDVKFSVNGHNVSEGQFKSVVDQIQQVQPSLPFVSTIAD